MSHNIFIILSKTGVGFVAFFVSWHFFTPSQPGMVPPGFENKIMHSSFRVGQTTVMASDGCSAEKASFQGFFLSLSVPSETEADRAFAALADGGQVRMPLKKTFWSPRFGMVVDRFGIGWMISVPGVGPE